MDQISFYQAKLAFETDSWDVYEMLNRGDAIIVIDARKEDAFERQHIPGAINIPHRTMTAETTSMLNKEGVLYVTYCDGIGCNASTKGALKMAQLGFNVKELLGGLDWWLRDGYETHGTEGKQGEPVSCGC